MTSKKNTTMLNWIITAVICLILLASIVLSVVAVISSGSGEQSNTTATPSADKTDEEDEDSFDPNNIIVREDPTVMTVDLLPVKYSEFCYFYYISAGEVLSEAESPADVVTNGVDGTPFETVIFNMAKEYAAKYVLYRQAYESQNYTVNETYELYLQSNFMMASDKEELDEMNAQLLYQYGVVRNEYIDILLCNDAIAAYRSVLVQEADYDDTELKVFYDEMESLFREKALRVIALNSTDAEIATQLKEKIENGYDMTSLVTEYSISTTKSSDQGLWEGNAADFNSEGMQNFLETATLGEVSIITEDSGIYVVRYENDGSFEKRKEDISAYKAVYDFDVMLTEKVKQEEVSITVEETLLEGLELPVFINEWIEDEDNTES